MTRSQSTSTTCRSRAQRLVFVFVLGLAFMLLLVVFRSIVIPVKAIVLNLLRSAPPTGSWVWVFQYGHFEDLLGFESIDGITAWLPLFLFVLLFRARWTTTCSSCRVREAYDGGMSNGRGDLARDQEHGRRDERGARDGLRVRHLRHPQRARFSSRWAWGWPWRC